MKQIQKKIINMDVDTPRLIQSRIHIRFALFIRAIDQFIKLDPKGIQTRRYLQYLSKDGVLESLPEGYFKSRDFSIFFP